MRFVLIAVLFILGAGDCFAQAVRLQVKGRLSDGEFTGRATAVCIGQTESGGSVFLTAKHNFRDAVRGWVGVSGKWHLITHVNEHPTADVASFESHVAYRASTVADSVVYGSRISMPGFGEEYHGTGPASVFHGILKRNEIEGINGLHPVTGDSGAAVLQDKRVVGIVSAYVETTRRSDHADRRYPIVYVGLKQIHECLQQRYQRCPPGGCQIYLRPQIQQPMIGVGIPVGPPRVVGVVSPPPQRLQPVPDDRFTPGPQGPPGRDGRSVTREEIESIVSAWLDANRESLRGPPGPSGLDLSSVDWSAIDARLKTVETRPIRVVISSDGKVVDEETYPSGEPIVLDLKRLRNSSDGQ